MTESDAEAKILPLRSISNIWLVPIVAVLIGAWMMYQHVSSLGPLITIEFETAEGIEAGKTKIKTRHVDIGEVESISLNNTSDGVIVTARMAPDAAKLLVADTVFYLVSPKITHAGVSGLSTILSGVHIEMDAGILDKPQEHYTALYDPPVTDRSTPGLHITLNSNDQFAYAKGDPIIYKGLTVGQFEDIYFNFDERVVYYNAFIKAPYHQLITSNTRFWDVSGLQIDLNADGLSVNTGNIQTLLTNGVTFGVPDGMPVGDRISKREYFDIYPDYEAADNERYKETVEYVVEVSNTIRGLQVGAPVEYRGVLVGHVLSTNILEPDSKELFDEDLKIPVLIGMQPGRVGLPDDSNGAEVMDAQNRLWIQQGMKAQLKTGNLLTGSQFIELQHYPDEQAGEISYYNGIPTIPTTVNEFAQITDKAERFLENLNSIPMDQLSDNTNVLLQELAQTARELQQTSQSIDAFINGRDQQAIAVKLNQALHNIALMTRDFSAGSKSYEQLNQSLKTLNGVMFELQPVLNQLKNRPNSLLFDDGEGKQDIEPGKYGGQQE